MRDVVLRCVAATDPAELSALYVQWYKIDSSGDRKLVNSSDGRIVVVQSRAGEALLFVTSTRVLDSGNYSCKASNGLDAASTNASLIVIGKMTELHYTMRCAFVC